MANHLTANPSPHSYNKENDIHVQAVDKLVHELGIPAEVVNNTYREVLDELRKYVTVKAYLPLLTIIEVKERLVPQR